MVVAMLEWIFIFPLVFILITYPNSLLQFKTTKYPLEEIINIYNLMTILKQRYIMDSLGNFDVDLLNFILSFLPNRIKVDVKYIFPIKIESSGTLILPIPMFSSFKLIDKYGRPINFCICNDSTFNIVVLKLNKTGFVCIDYVANLFFDPDGNMIAFEINNSKTCLYTNSNTVLSTNSSIPVKFIFYNITFTNTTYRIINVTKLNWVKIYTNYTGTVYLIIGEGENYKYCSCKGIQKANYFLPIELLKLWSLKSMPNEEVLAIPIKYRDFYILVEVLK